MNPSQHTITIGELARELGKDPSTLSKWLRTDIRLRACVLRKTQRSVDFSVQRLRDAGWLVAASALPTPAITYEWKTA